MTRERYRYTFAADVPFEDVEASLLLALWGAESLHGAAAMRLAGCHAVDAASRTCVIDAGSPVGRDVNRLLVGFLSREYSRAAFHVERLDQPAGDDHQPAPPLEEVPA